MSTSFARTAVERCAIRPTLRVSGKGGGEDLTGLRCTPLDPPSAGEGEILRREGLESPYALLVTYLPGALDIPDGALLVVGSRTYPIRRKAVFRETVGGLQGYTKLVVEDLRK